MNLNVHKVFKNSISRQNRQDGMQSVKNYLTILQMCKANSLKWVQDKVLT